MTVQGAHRVLPLVSTMLAEIDVPDCVNLIRG